MINVVQPSHLPELDADVVNTLVGTARGARNGRDELSMLPQVFAQAQALTTLDDLPVAVMTASESFDGTAGWAKAQDRLAALSTNTMHRVVDSTHIGMIEDQVPAQASATAIDDVVDAVRTGTSVNGG